MMMMMMMQMDEINAAQELLAVANLQRTCHQNRSHPSVLSQRIMSQPWEKCIDLWRLRKHNLPNVKRRNQQVDCSDYAPPAIQKAEHVHVQRSRLAFRHVQATWKCNTGHGSMIWNAASVLMNRCFHRHIPAWHPQRAGVGEWITLLQNTAILHWAFIFYSDWFDISVAIYLLHIFTCCFNSACSSKTLQVFVVWLMLCFVYA